MPNSESSFLHQGAATLGTNGWHAPTLDSEQKFHVSQQSSNTTLSYRHGSAGGRLHHSLGCDFMLLLALAGTNNKKPSRGLMSHCLTFHRTWGEEGSRILAL